MKKRLLTGAAALLLCGSALTLSAQALPRAVPVTLDGVRLNVTSYMDSGVTSVPLRTLCDALGSWDISWDGGQHCAVAVSNEGTTITAKPGECYLSIDGATHTTAAPVYLEGGRTYVPLRTLCDALGLSVAWDPALGGAAVTDTGNDANSNAGTSLSHSSTYSAQDLYWLSRIISAESQGESLTGQIAVGNVILNRVASSKFPNTIYDVIFDTKDGVQFEPVSLGTLYQTPTERSVEAAKAVLSGSNVIGNCLYFFDPSMSNGTWMRANRTYYTTIGCHRFYL